MKASFAEFYVLWDEHLGRDTPLFHIETCEWMEILSDEVDNLLMLPRGHNKSGIVTVYNAWRFYCDVDDLLLHQGATNIDALKCSRAVVRILANHPLCKINDVSKSHGGVIKWWVKGSSDEQYGSMYARGILSSVTGQRAKHIQNDDVEVQKNVATEENREKLKHSLTEQTHILVPGGTSLFIGTPHSYESIYKEMIEAGANSFIRRMFEHEYRIEGRNEAILNFHPEYVFSGIHKYSKCLEENKHYTVEKNGDGVKVKLLEDFSMVDFYAKALWPERFTKQEMTKRRKKCRTLNEWDSQYQLHAKPIGDVRLDPDKLIPYDCEPVLKIANKKPVMILGNVRIASASLRVDPSSGKKNSDISSAALILHDEQGRMYWHRSIGLTGEVAEFDESGRDIIGGQVFQLVQVIKEFSLTRVTVETNGIGGFFPSVLKSCLKQQGIRCGVSEIPSTQNKNLRILNAIEGPLNSGVLWAHISVLTDAEKPDDDSYEVRIMRSWNPAVTNQVDDPLDSLAGAISDEPVRIGKSHNKEEYKESPNWRTNGGVHEATLDFEY
ncbi:MULTISPECIES: phage terminase large subunit [unclassified Acinetobacter]|uniref:phage terminase large subunit n=1 Tax=unclassified Acinetobacter TaxID=196816 RepID=UPI0012501729|nr:MULTISPECIES: phage terminase large subunit [unclassified Acinetobacter]